MVAVQSAHHELAAVDQRAVSRPAECPRQPPQRALAGAAFDLFERHVDRRFFFKLIDQPNQIAVVHATGAGRRQQDHCRTAPPPQQAASNRCRGCSHTPTAQFKTIKKKRTTAVAAGRTFERAGWGRPVASKCMATVQAPSNLDVMTATVNNSTSVPMTAQISSPPGRLSTSRALRSAASGPRSPLHSRWPGLLDALDRAAQTLWIAR